MIRQKVITRLAALLTLAAAAVVLTDLLARDASWGLITATALVAGSAVLVWYAAEAE